MNPDEEILIKIAKTSMQSKLISEDGDPLSKVVVRAVMNHCQQRVISSSKTAEPGNRLIFNSQLDSQS